MRNLVPISFILLIVALCNGCAKLSSSSLNAAVVQEQMLQENTTAVESEIAPIVRAQSSILTLPPAMRLSTHGPAAVDSPEARSSRSEARHQRALKFAQAQKDVIAKYQRQKQESQNAIAVGQSQVTHLSTIVTQPASAQLSKTDSISTPATSENPQAPLEASYLHLSGRRTPIFITLLVIALGGLTWPLARGPRHSIHDWIQYQGTRRIETKLPDPHSEAAILSLSALPEPPPKPQPKGDHQFGEQESPLSSDTQPLQMIAQIESLALALEVTVCMATWASNADVVLTDNFDTSRLPNEKGTTVETRAAQETLNSRRNALAHVIANCQRRLGPTVQTIKLNPMAERFSKAHPLALPYYCKANDIATVQHAPSTALICIDQTNGLPMRAAHHRGVSLSDRAVGLPRSIVGVVVLFPQGENGEAVRQVMMVESYELDEHSQLTATVVRVA